VRLLAKRGFQQAVSDDVSLAKGVMCYKKCLTHEYFARKKKMDFVNLLDLIRK
jgi:alanine dehydrogenase